MMKRTTVNFLFGGSISFAARATTSAFARAAHLIRVALPVLALGAGAAKAASLEDLWRERTASVVAVEFTLDDAAATAANANTVGATPIQAFGTVIDAQGTVIFSTGAIELQTPPSALRDFRLYLPGGDTDAPLPAHYLGYDAFTEWHFVRVDSPSDAARLVPITRFRNFGLSTNGGAVRPHVAEELWGIGLRKKDEDFAPYFLSSRVSLVAEVPEAYAFAAREVAGPGLPVFNLDGDFVGLGQSGFGQAALQFSQRDREGLPVVMLNPDETSAVLLAEEVVQEFITHIPASPHTRTIPWAGLEQVRVIDRANAERLGLVGRPALLVGDVLPNSPAAKAGMQPGDAIISLNSRALPAIRPLSRLVRYLERDIARRAPGDTLFIEVVRDRADESRMLILTLENAPY